MKLFKKETLFLAIVLVVAVVGLLQLFHEEAYAVFACSAANCPTDPNTCFPTRCACNGVVYTCGNSPCGHFCIQ